ncbi:MAG: acyltransferase [Hyphomicrobiales bacterium]|nr:acyltransferase [Hyphomicrobiales bacterium]
MLTGQIRLQRLYNRYQAEKDSPHRRSESFFDAAIRLLDLNVRFDAAKLCNLPKTGPMLIVANHPFGVVDGLVLTWLALKVRRDVKVLANSVLCEAPEARHHLLPVHFSGTDKGNAITIDSRRQALEWLMDGGVVAIFPGGGAATVISPFESRAFDLKWVSYTASLVQRAHPTIVPIYFDGQNSRAFQIASHLSPTLRTSLYCHEAARLIGKSLDVAIGDPISHDRFVDQKNRAAIVAELRQQTFALSGRPNMDCKLRVEPEII